MVDLVILRQITDEVFSENASLDRSKLEGVVQYYISNFIAFRTEEFANDLFQVALEMFPHETVLSHETRLVIRKKVAAIYSKNLHPEIPIEEEV